MNPNFRPLTMDVVRFNVGEMRNKDTFDRLLILYATDNTSQDAASRSLRELSNGRLDWEVDIDSKPTKKCRDQANTI